MANTESEKLKTPRFRKYKFYQITGDTKLLIASFKRRYQAERTLELFLDQEKDWNFQSHYQIRLGKKVLVSR